MATAFLRGKVSKKKKRFQEDGFDLDLTYITPNVIAMGFPSEGMEARYRNPMPDVQRFFSKRHPNHYKIYNVCSERHYENSKFQELEEGSGITCHQFVWDDHNPPPLKLMEPMVEDMVTFLTTDTKNVVAVHCKAGKGRTGTIIACLLLKLRAGGINTANEALRKFAIERTHNAKGVTIPSQMRYVHYYSKILEEGTIRQEKMLRLKHVRLVTVPVFDSVALQGGGCDPYFHIKVRNTKGKMIKIYDYKKENKVRHVKSKERKADIDCATGAAPPPLHGDIKMIFYDYDSYSSDDKMFHIWFNTAYVENNYLRFTKAVTDKACKDLKCKHFSNDFEVELFFETVAASDGDGAAVDYDNLKLDGSDGDNDTDEDEEALREAEEQQGGKKE